MRAVLCTSTRPLRVIFVGLVTVASCVPNGPAASDAGAQVLTPTARSAWDASPFAVRHPPNAEGGLGGATGHASPPLGPGFEDNFDRPSLGMDWTVTPGSDWHIDHGKLCVKGAHNHGVWLARTLPTNVRIEFDAVSQSQDGDIKAEIFGDGTSAASGTSYNDATSYITIFGGWRNTYHVLARLNEHASDRPEIKITPGLDDERARPVTAGQIYHFKLERADGKTVAWWIGDMQMFRFPDPQPLTGPGHDHLGFNDWEVPVCFDNVKVVPL